MNEQFSLGGFFHSPSGERNQVPVLRNPTEEEVFAQLDLLYTNNGFLSLWKGVEDEPGECSLNVTCDSGKCYVECSEVTPKGDRIIHRIHAPEKQAKEVALFGQYYNDQSLMDNVGSIRELYSYFLKTNGSIPSCFSVNN